MNSYSPYASTPNGHDFYYEKKDYISPSPTPSPRGPAYFHPQQPPRPATRAHFRHMSSGANTAGFYDANNVGSSPSSRPPTFSPRYSSDGHYATANVSFSPSTRKQSSRPSPSASPRARRSSFSYSRTPTRTPEPSGDSDRDVIVEVDGVTYVLTSGPRPKPWTDCDQGRSRSCSHGRSHSQSRSQSQMRNEGQSRSWSRGYHSSGYHSSNEYSRGHRTNHEYAQGGYSFVEKDLRAGFESPRYHAEGDARRTTPTGHTRRSSTAVPPPQRSSTVRPASSHHQPPPPTKKASSVSPPRATEADAKKYQIPAGYQLKNWDPSEEPILLLGSVFDANSLGKWIYDWTTYHHGPSSPISEIAGELWLLLIQLSGKIKRAEECIPQVRAKENREMLDDFILSGERLTDKLRKLLKACEAPMLRTNKISKSQLGKNAGIEFVETLFGRDREMEKTERFMQSVRLWSLRFDANCEDIIREPTR